MAELALQLAVKEEVLDYSKPTKSYTQLLAVLKQYFGPTNSGSSAHEHFSMVTTKPRCIDLIEEFVYESSRPLNATCSMAEFSCEDLKDQVAYWAEDINYEVDFDELLLIFANNKFFMDTFISYFSEAHNIYVIIANIVLPNLGCGAQAFVEAMDMKKVCDYAGKEGEVTVFIKELKK